VELAELFCQVQLQPTIKIIAPQLIVADASTSPLR